RAGAARAAVERLVGHADGQVVTAVAVEVPDRQAVAELVAGLLPPLDAGAVLRPALRRRERGGQPGGAGAINHVHGADIALLRPRPGVLVVLERRADGQVVAAVAVEVPCRQGEAELVAPLGGARDAGAVLGPELVAGGGQPGD